MAKLSGSAVRVCKPDGPDQNLPGPIPKRGHALTWYLDLHHPSASKRVSKYLKQWKPRHMWLSIPCTSRTQVQYLNRRNFVNGRPQNEKNNADYWVTCGHEPKYNFSIDPMVFTVSSRPGRMSPLIQQTNRGSLTDSITQLQYLAVALACASLMASDVFYLKLGLVSQLMVDC